MKSDWSFRVTLQVAQQRFPLAHLSACECLWFSCDLGKFVSPSLDSRVVCDAFACLLRYSENPHSCTRVFHKERSAVR